MPGIQIRSESGIKLGDIVSQLKQKGYQLDGVKFSYYSSADNAFIEAATDSVESTALALHNQVLILQAWVPTQEELQPAPVQERKKRKRTKERKIEVIVDKVNTWRQLYNGYRDHKGKLVKLSLEEAADRLGISKKSLDDYFLQMKLGRKNGFDFNAHKKDNVGVLRAFNK